jgi:glycerol uptake facilitator protein
MTNAYLAEIVGTALLVLFGNGVVCNVLLSQTKGHGAGWLTIAAGWGLAVFVGAFCAADASGAHLNPAVTAAFVVAGKLESAKAFGYILAQFVGAGIGATLVYLSYRAHFDATEDSDAKLACFSTGPAIRNLPQALLCETIGTFALLLPILLMSNPSLTLGTPSEVAPVLGLGALGPLPVGLLVFAIGVSLGGTTGYAINPARDLGPRIVHFLLPIRGKRDSDWEYAWVPVVGPILGAVVAAAIYRFLLVG